RGQGGATAYLTGDFVLGFNVVIDDPTAPFGQLFHVTATDRSGNEVASGFAVNQISLFTQALFPIRNTGSNTSANNYLATVSFDGVQILQFQGADGASGPGGVRGYIVGSNGSYQVVIRDPLAPIGKTYSVTVTTLDGSRTIDTG